MALPDEACRFRLEDVKKGWTETDEWAWKEICEGRTVNFNDRLKEEFNPTDPEHLNKWSDKGRMLHRNFLKTILLHEPFQSAIPPWGVHIIGAVFQHDVDLRYGTIDRRLFLEESAFAASVLLGQVTTSATVSFNGSKITGKLGMNTISVGGNLYMRKKAEFKDVDMTGAIVGGLINMTGSTFRGTLGMNGISVGRSLFMGEKADFEDVVDMTGAIVGEQIDMNGSTFRGTLGMNGISVGESLFMRKKAEFKDVDMTGAIVGGLINMTGSTFRGTLGMNGISVGRSLFMGEKADFEDVVDMTGAIVGEQIDMNGSTFRGTLGMNGISVGESLFMRKKAEFKDVDMTGAIVGGQLGMTGSTFRGTLGMEAISVGRNLFMHKKAEFEDVNMTGANVGGQISMTGSTFRGTLDMDAISVGESLFMRGQAEFKDVSVISSRIDANLDARSAILGNLDLTGTKIGGELRLGTIGNDVAWKNYNTEDKEPDSPRMILQNTNVGALQDTKSSWPSVLELNGFTFERLGGFRASEEELPHNRGSDWYIDWLERDQTYSPQPYRQLARILDASGHQSMASDILFASREREFREAWPDEPKKWLGLLMLRMTVGYGHGWRYFWALGWVAFFTVLGTGILRLKEERLDNGKKLGFWYSLDMLLPIVRLREKHYEADLSNEWVRYYFFGHKVVGYVLVFFVLAGMTGLTEWI
ncbi:MAG: hypothetical protein OXF88_17830 [Rhodobacteraceae bacterium]|nr:hypothetical protein [Paracoccaceae bacterium]